MAAVRISAGVTAPETYEAGDNLVERRSILASHTWQTVNSELNLGFYSPINLADSSAARDVFQEDATHGSLPARHITVSFLGDARAGKTSLEKHLLDKTFNPAEEATKGLEFDLVQTDVTEVGEGWQAVQDGPYSKYNTGRAQYVALQILREMKSLVDPPKFLGPATIALLNYALAMAVITMTSLSIGFQLGFGVALLLKIGIFKLFGQSNYVAAIYGMDAIVIHLVFDFFTRYGLLRNIFFAFGNEHSVWYHYLQFVMFVIVIVVLSFVVVLPWPVGGRPGISFAFCLVCAPTQLYYDDLASHFQLTADVSPHTCLLAAAIFMGVVVSSSGGLVSAVLVLLLTALGITNTTDSERLDYMLSLVGGLSAGATGYMTCDIMKRLCNFNRRGLQLQILMGPIGFVYGIGLCWLYGWHMVCIWPSTRKDAYYMVPNIVAIFLIVQVERQRVDLAFQEMGSYPAVLVSRSIKTITQVKDLPLKFTLIDFAGDTVYHCTHHLFLSNLAIHLIVFNMERLEQEPDYIRRICYWVQSVTVHVQNPNPHIFIVGTHTHSLSLERRKFLSSKVSRALLSNETFAQFIVGKPDNNKDVLFCVENSLPLGQDPRACVLRKTIMEVAASSFQSKRHVPIKWLKVSDFVNKYKCSSKATCLMDKRALLHKLSQEGAVEAEDKGEEFEQMLKFYDEIGELQVMGDVVVLNMKALVQLVVELVELDCDDHELGIVHVTSLRRVWKFLTAENFLSAIALFERYDILCPISQEQYLVPLLLETSEVTTAKQEEADQDASAFWDTEESDTVLYFKFYKFHPEAIFLRLLARCLSISQKTHDLGRGADRDVYRNVGRFYQGHDFYYKMELVCPSVEQNMIQVTVKCAPNRGPHSLLSRLHNDLQQIRDRDFPYLNYTAGFPCPACSSFNKREGARKRDNPSPHILRVAGHDEELPRPGEKATLMCRGKAFEVDLGVHQQTLDAAQPVKTGESKTSQQKSVREYFFFVKEKVSSDWKDLALFLDLEDSGIRNIANRNPDDKSRCMDMLEVWVRRRGGGATLEVLMEALSNAGLQNVADGLRK
ncbi:THOC1 [Branchiostoma lanceolatum]|uniref:THOC1 protein n=1 Tax=Branchiostoma lanceolatum TaxID=7740 RepID=A0A8J9YY34_BRALA|nr:THOC1 [Branchiostoma lanceolatum]